VKRATRRRAASGFILTAMIAALAAAQATGSSRVPSRYFEVKFIASGTLNSAPVCTVNMPCSGDYLTGHGMAWQWTAYALVVATQQGRHTTLHLIGPQPRVAAFFNENISWSQRDDCTANFSTGGGENLTGFMATRMRFEDEDGIMSVDTGPPLDQHFSQCGPGTVSPHGREDTLASWDGLDGPWHYAGVRGPTRAQVRSKERIFVDFAYNLGLGVEHTEAGWLHTSCCGSNLTVIFTRFRGGKKSVLAHERNFKRKHPVTSHGFVTYDLLSPTG
jgi:hypothetical protein